MKHNSISSDSNWHALMVQEEVAAYLGLPVYTIPLLAKAGILPPLGRPAKNGVKRFARVEIEHLAQDRHFLSKAVSIIERSIQEKNRKAQQKKSETRGLGRPI